MKEVIDVKTKYINYPCIIEFAQYRNGQISIKLADADTGDPAATATACLDGVIDIDWQSNDFKGVTAIKDYAENEGMFKALIKAGIIEPTGKVIQTEYVAFPLARVLRNG